MYQLTDQDVRDSQTRDAKGLFACCAKPSNREDVPTNKPDQTQQRCRVCGRNHYEVTLDPGKMGLKGAVLGQ